MTRSTYTIAELELSPAAYDEISAKLRAAGYDHAFMESGVIDMHGIGVMQRAVPNQDVPLGWYWADSDEAEYWRGPYADKDAALDAARIGIDWSQLDAESRSCTVYLVTARPMRLVDDIFSSENVVETWEGRNEECADMDGELHIDPSDDQRLELEHDLAHCFAAWRARHGLGRAYALDVVQHFEQEIDCPDPAAFTAGDDNSQGSGP